MNKLFKYIAVVCVLFTSAFVTAQNPQTTTAPISAINSKYVNGVAPGYWSTAGSGLTLNVGAGTSFCSGTVVTYAGGTLTLTASSTNNIYLNTASSCAVSTKTTAFTSTDIPIALVVTSGSAITSITDLRTMFVQGAPSSVPTTSLTGVLQAAQEPAHSGDVTNSASSLTMTVKGINGTLLSTLTTGPLCNTASTGTPFACGVANIPGFSGVTVTGTPTTGQVPTATSGSAATWQTPPTGHSSAGAAGEVQNADGSGGFTDSTCSAISGAMTCPSLSSTGSGGLAGGVDYTEGTTNSVSASGHARIQALSSTNKLQASINAGAYSNLEIASDLTFAAQTDSSSVTWAITSAQANASLTLVHTTSTRALNFTGLVNGGSYVYVLKQDSTGGAAATLGTGCTWYQGGSTGFTASTTLALTTTASAINILAFTYDGTNCYANLR